MEIDEPVKPSSSEDRARDRIMHELADLKGKDLRSLVQKHAQREVAYLSLMAGKDGKSVSVVVDGRNIWYDLTISLTKETFTSSDEKERPRLTEAKEVCLELIRLTLSLPATEFDEPNFYVVPFEVWNDEVDAPLWQQVLDNWSN